MQSSQKFFLPSLFLLSALASCATPHEKATTDTGTDQSRPVSPEKGTDKGQNVAKPQAASIPKNHKSTCTSDKDTRIMEVNKTKLGGCELFYTKFGKTQSVATANIGTRYCEEVKERIQSNLEKAGFSCR